jgi:poly(hydroxyalkanoate) granule-associated protein
LISFQDTQTKIYRKGEKEMAAESKKAKVDNTVEEVHGPLYDASRRVLLASIGAIALAQDEIEDFVEKLVERGEIAEKDGKKLVREVIDKRKKDVSKAEDELNKRIDEVVTRMDVPTKADIDALGDQINELSDKVDGLAKE